MGNDAQTQDRGTETADDRRALALGIRGRAEARDAEGDRPSEGLTPDGPAADLEDMRVTRRDGKIEPIKRRSIFEAHVIEFRPITYRDRNRYRLDERGLIMLEDDERLEFLREHMVAPSFDDVLLFDDFAARRGIDVEYDDLSSDAVWEALAKDDRDAIAEATFLEDFGFTTIDDLLNTIQRYSRDRRRDKLPRPVSENGGKAAEGEAP